MNRMVKRYQSLQYQTQPSTGNDGVRRHVVKHAANCLSELFPTSLGPVLPRSTRSFLFITVSRKTALPFHLDFSHFSPKVFMPPGGGHRVPMDGSDGLFVQDFSGTTASKFSPI